MKRDVFMTPWDEEFYPSPRKNDRGKITKNINMTVVAHILFSTGLAFCAVSNESSLTRKLHKQNNGAGYRQLHVKHIYKMFAEQNKKNCIQIWAMWRLKPTEQVWEGTVAKIKP